MRKLILPAILATLLVAMPSANATNGDNLIGVGPVSRAMGGVGVAAPQDSVTAIFINPAAMGFCPCGAQSEAVMGGTVFDPAVSAKITTPMGTLSGDSQHKAFVIPAVGVTMPIGDQWRFGLGAYGVSGLGVDYRNKFWDLDGDPSNGYEGDLYTRLEIMKFSPMLSYQVNEDLAVGAALQIAYNNLDLGSGGTHNYAYGAQLGVVYSLGEVQLGASYTTPQNVSFDRVANFDAFTGDPSLDTLDLESPGTYIAGISYQPSQAFVAEFDAKYYDWANADGYKDFDWDSQLVLAIGAQYQASDKLFVRAGFNYAENPVNEHNGWNPDGLTSIQGTAVPTFGYEMFRIIGFPAIVESHLTLGVGYKLTESMMMNIDYMHAFDTTITESSMGNAITLESEMYQDALGLSLAWAFE